MNITLPPDLERFVRQKVSSGHYSTSSDVVRDALQILAAREATPSRGSSKGSDKNTVRSKLLELETELRKRGIVEIALFGSLVRAEAHCDSDVDILIEIAPQAHFSLIDLMDLKLFLEDKLDRDVDLVTREGLDPQLRDSILAEAEVVFS